MQAAAQVASPDFDWSCIDTVLLDMDGTILDLHYDNWVWDEALPAAFGQLSGRTKEGARQVVRVVLTARQQIPQQGNHSR